MFKHIWLAFPASRSMRFGCRPTVALGRQSLGLGRVAGQGVRGRAYGRSVDPSHSDIDTALLVRISLAQAVVHWFLRWQNWSDTRCAAVGVSARLFMGSLLVGLENLITLVDRYGQNNDKYYLGAAKKRLTTQIKKYIGIAALGCYPLEGFVLSLLEDSRAATQIRKPSRLHNLHITA